MKDSLTIASGRGAGCPCRTSRLGPTQLIFQPPQGRIGTCSDKGLSSLGNEKDSRPTAGFSSVIGWTRRTGRAVVKKEKEAAVETVQQVLNFVNGGWHKSQAGEVLGVTNPATAEEIAQVPLSPADEVDRAVIGAAHAFREWRRTPSTQRVQYLYQLKRLLEQNLDEMAAIVTRECGKTLLEARGEVQRGIENVEVACGIPSLIQGYNSEDIAPGIDEMMIRQPVGIFAAITPFNFPAMIPLWFIPYAIACGNCIILKPSEKVPLTAQKILELVEQTGLPKGVLQLVNGSKGTVDAILDHPLIAGVSFVGSTPVAKYIYGRAAAEGKRVQCQGGAKNPLFVLPDADMEATARIIGESAFGCAGQRCLAGSLVATVGSAHKPFREAISDIARSRRVGFGLDEGVEMGPVISSESKDRIENLVSRGAQEGANLAVDGRHPDVPGYEQGYFVGPTILSDVQTGSSLLSTEIFGPVLTLLPFERVDDAIEFVNRGRYGNMACLFTSSGAAARKFRYEVEAGNIGINIGVAAPVASFPFSGWKDSFFGDLHGQGRDAIEFYTHKKVVIERWP